MPKVGTDARVSFAVLDFRSTFRWQVGRLVIECEKEESEWRSRGVRHQRKVIVCYDLRELEKESLERAITG